MTNPGKQRSASYPPGRQPYDRLNAIRVGALSGGALGTVLAATMRGLWALAIVVGAAVGGFVGAWWDARSNG